jgi:hypothetical protein
MLNISEFTNGLDIFLCWKRLENCLAFSLLIIGLVVSKSLHVTFISCESVQSVPCWRACIFPELQSHQLQVCTSYWHCLRLFHVADLSNSSVWMLGHLIHHSFYLFGCHSVITLLKPEAQSCSYVCILPAIFETHLSSFAHVYSTAWFAFLSKLTIYTFKW